MTNWKLGKVLLMEKADVKAVVENRFRELGAKQLAPVKMP